MSDLSWKDALLLREMERFETRDRSVTGPRAPMPELASPQDIAECVTVRAMQLEDQCDTLSQHCRYLQGQLRQRPVDLLRMVEERNAAVVDARRMARAFRMASLIAGMMSIAAAAGWLR